MHDLAIYPADGLGGFAEVGEVLGTAGIRAEPASSAGSSG